MNKAANLISCAHWNKSLGVHLSYELSQVKKLVWSFAIAYQLHGSGCNSKCQLWLYVQQLWLTFMPRGRHQCNFFSQIPVTAEEHSEFVNRLVVILELNQVNLCSFSTKFFNNTLSFFLHFRTHCKNNHYVLIISFPAFILNCPHFFTAVTFTCPILKGKEGKWILVLRQ